MIKKIHEITLRDILILEETRKATHLKKIKWIPFILLKWKFEKLAKDIYDRIGSKSIDDLQNEFEKLLSYRRLQLLEALYNAAYIALFMQTKINVFKLILNQEPIEDKYISEILEKIKRIARIEIKEPGDFKNFEKKIQRYKDKYDERYKNTDNEEAEKQPERSTTEIIYSYFQYLREPLNEDMRLLTFLSMRKMADEKMHAQKLNENADE